MPKDVYQDLIYKLSKKYNISDLEIERIVDSQFKLVADNITNKTFKTINLIHIGKFTPTLYKLRAIQLENDKKECTTDNRGLGEETSGNKSIIPRQENEDMQPLSNQC